MTYDTVKVFLLALILGALILILMTLGVAVARLGSIDGHMRDVACVLSSNICKAEG